MLTGFVVPHAGTWIEIAYPASGLTGLIVVPHAGTWIEIDGKDGIPGTNGTSFPTRERGLKYWKRD